MRAQTSLEFLLVLSIVSVLGLSAVAFYAKGMSLNSEAVSTIATPPANSTAGNLTPAENPQVSVYVPLNSTLFSENEAVVDAYGCSSGEMRIEPHSGTVAFPYANASANVSSIAIINLGFEPTEAGLNVIGINYSISCPGKNISSSGSFNTYATSHGQEGTQASAYIVRRNESVVYAAATSQVIALQQFNHCTITDFWTGRVYTVGGQCGTESAWDFMSFDGSCLAPYWSYSRTYCVVPVSAGYNISAPNPYNYTEGYNISLVVSTSAGILRSNLSSGEESSEVLLGGIAVGNATVVGVESDEPSPEAEITNQSGGWIANESQYEAYQQAYNNLYSTLGFYNTSGYSSQVGEAAAAFEDASGRMIGSMTPVPQDSCTLSGGRFFCPAIQPLSYTIDLSLSRNLNVQNTTIDYQGSGINIDGG